VDREGGRRKGRILGEKRRFNEDGRWETRMARLQGFINIANNGQVGMDAELEKLDRYLMGRRRRRGGDQ
jgi:hypothetical protein